MRREGAKRELGARNPEVMRMSAFERLGVERGLGFQRVDRLAGKKAVAQSALGRSMLEREGMALVEKGEGRCEMCDLRI